MNQQWTRGPMIGRGSSATVHLAMGSHSSDPFAVKSAEFSRSADLHREQRILSTLDCPDIIAYLGYDISTEADGRRYYNLLMEYAAGGSLSDYIKKQGGRLDQQAIRWRTHEILSGLVYLHSRRIVHCDVKPQNILIGADGQAKIADFGCARWGVDTEQIILGTPRFMAPEVARGEEQGLAADVWALGCTVLEMATGAPAWPEVFDPITVLHRIAFSTQVPEIPSWFSDEGRDFLDKCFRRDPNERWTVEQLIRHPFVADRSNHDRRTPKSILDQDMWDSMSEGEDYQRDEVVEDSTDNETDMMNELVTGEPNWTWDESWVTLREFETFDGSVQLEVEAVAEDIALMAPAISSTGVATSIASTSSDEDTDTDNFITSVVTSIASISIFVIIVTLLWEMRVKRGCLIVMDVALYFIMELMLLEDKRPAYCLLIFLCYVSCWLFHFCHSLDSLLILVQ